MLLLLSGCGLDPSKYEKVEPWDSEKTQNMPTQEELVYRPFRVALHGSRQTRWRELTEAARNETLSLMGNVGGVKVYEREQLAAIMAEQGRSLDAAFNADGSFQVGGLQNVDFLVVPEISGYSYNSKSETIKVPYFNANTQKWSTRTKTRWVGEARIQGRVRLLDTQTSEVTTLDLDGQQRQVVNSRGDLNEGSLRMSLVRNQVRRLEQQVRRLFPLRAYVERMKGHKKIARINRGSEHGVKNGDRFALMKIREETDPLTGEKETRGIQVGKIRIRLVQQDGAWGYLDRAGQENCLIGMRADRLPYR
jgi:hypothetical protein